MVRCGLSRRVWRARVICRCFGKAALRSERAEYFISGNVNEAAGRTLLRGPLLPFGESSLEKRIRTHNVCLDERSGRIYRSVNVRLRRKMVNYVRRIAIKAPPYRTRVGNIDLLEDEIGIRHSGFERFEISRVRE